MPEVVRGTGSKQRDFGQCRVPHQPGRHLSCPQVLLGPQPHADTASHGDLLWQPGLESEGSPAGMHCQVKVLLERASLSRGCHKPLLLLHPLNSQSLVAHNFIKLSAEF